MLITLLSFFSLHLFLRAAEPVKGIWQVLEGCRLVQSPINDGDSFEVKHKNGNDIFRLYFVDAPETYTTYPDRIRDQARYFSISEEDVTATGKLATEFTQKFLRGEFTVITRWEDARGSSRQPRYFALIQKGDRDLSTELIRAGLARLYGKPTETTWPGGVTPRTFLGRLKNSERAAQGTQSGIWSLAAGSLQMSGLEALSRETVSPRPSELPHGSHRTALKARININTAESATLQELPGIGPALAARIIDARPITSIQSLVEIPGISANTLAGFSQMILTEAPPPPPFTVAYYQADLERYMNQKVIVQVASVAQSEASRPQGFRAVLLQTAYQGENGGSITTFIPDEFYESFINYYREAGREFTGLLYSHDGDVVLVYPRN